MIKEVYLKVIGEPMGKQRPKFSTYNGFVKTYTPKDTLNYEGRVKHEYQVNYEGMVFEPHEQLKAVIIAYYQIPKGHYKFYKRTNQTALDRQGELMLKGLKRPIKKPDTDNIAKICLDSLNGIAYHDDSQIVELCVEKWYAKEPSVEIAIWRVNDENY